MIRKYLAVWTTTILALMIAAVPMAVAAQFSNPNIRYEKAVTPSQGDGERTIYRFDSPLTDPLVFTLENQPEGVKAPYAYSGLAVYLGMAPALKVMPNGRVKTVKFKKGAPATSDGEWTGYKGRFESVMLKAPGAVVTVTPEILTVNWPAGVTPDLTLITGHQDTSVPPETDQNFDIRRLQYSHLPRWMGALCRFVEWIYKTIQSATGLSWGVCLILFAVVIKLLMLPFSMLTTRFQNQVNEHKAALEPIFDDIKKNFKGEVAHNKTMAAYKARGITPYYTLKPLLATMIGLPVLIAIFNMLGEIEPLKTASFLWMDSLAYPDHIATLPFTIPLFGNSLNLMPFLMTGVTVFSTFTLKNAKATPRELKKQKRNLYLMAALFFLIFYPFPSGMVFYWTLFTLLQLVVNKILKA